MELVACGEVMISGMVSFTSAPETPRHFIPNLNGFPLLSNGDACYGQVRTSAPEFLVQDARIRLQSEGIQGLGPVACGDVMMSVMVRCKLAPEVEVQDLEIKI